MNDDTLAPLRALAADFKAGLPVLAVRTGDWASLRDDAAPVRVRVFVHEQGIPAEMEWDQDDATALHVVVASRAGVPVATGRLLRGGPGIAKIGRVAVHEALRGAGVGRLVMRTLMDAARDRGDREVVLHAQRSAEAFYRDLGFIPRGEPFDEVGIPHIEMAAPLRAG
ncbi:GNAT family N-acetyltransferase [Ramlibacter sp. MAHUQ-53]|uniref:GNAT family N-acetyltransferase n=1 Tax=unclassified Ramlibacter TaxID=2617605 RepID=UPI003640A4C8